jgi:hypothetical protein
MKMRLFKTLLLASILIALIGVWWTVPASETTLVQAQSPTQIAEEDRPHRKTTITIPFVRYHWWLLRYSNSTVVCGLSVEHEGLPTAADIRAFCEPWVYNEWVLTKPCDFAEVGTIDRCPGFYLLEMGSKPGERQIEIELPLPTVWVTLTNCNPVPPDNRCTTLPSLLLTGEEPLPNEVIISIQGKINGEVFRCSGSTCTVPLRPSGLDGTQFEFWADSSFGDSTNTYTARVRLVPWGDFMDPESTSQDPRLWYVDVLSSQWRDGLLASCSDIWRVFPEIGGPPYWLSSPESVQELETDISYYYLSGALITHGVVDASSCLDGGLQAPNIASPCGVEVARPLLPEWQNRFDQEIMNASQETGVPARLLKNVFSRESQIWPGLYTTYQEAGLGQLTDKGADTILLWNPDFFRQFCPLVLGQAYCELGFGNLKEPEQNMLRGALVRKVDASCPDCPAGIDISDANYSVRVFAEGMLANCTQVAQIIHNLTDLSAGQTSSYEDLWRFTLVNYNAGPGCLSRALQRVWASNRRLNWDNLIAELEPVCQPAAGYVEDISRELRATPTPTPWIPRDEGIATPELPRVISTPTPTQILPTVQFTPFPTPTVTPTGFFATQLPATPTIEGYPYPEVTLPPGTPYP